MLLLNVRDVCSLCRDLEKKKLTGHLVALSCSDHLHDDDDDGPDVSDPSKKNIVMPL